MDEQGFEGVCFAAKQTSANWSPFTLRERPPKDPSGLKGDRTPFQETSKIHDEKERGIDPFSRGAGSSQAGMATRMVAVPEP